MSRTPSTLMKMTGNRPDEEHVDEHGECRVQIETLANHIAVLLNQLALFPAKHPQQTAERQAAKEAINF